MKFEEYRACDAIALADRVRAGETSAGDLVQTATEAAKRADRAFNCLSFTRFDAALEDARHVASRPGRFDGVPFLLKDSGLAARALPSSMGSRLFDPTTFEGDATLTARFKAAGFVTLARSTAPEFSMAPTTEARRNGGPTRNPFDPERSSGGSSGGAGVAVAAGVVPAAHGSDGGGSIRIPASCCGVFGLKPSRGLVPMGPYRGEGWGGLAADGVLSRSVRDTARALDLVAGKEPGAPYAAPPGAGGFEAALSRPLEGPLTIGVWRDPFGLPLHPACTEGLDAAVAACADNGHEIMALEAPDLDYGAFIDAITTVMAVNVAVSVDARLGGRALEPGMLEPALADAHARGGRMSGPDYVRAINRFHATGREMARMMRSCEVVLSPTLTAPPVPLGTISTETPDFAAFRRNAGELTAFLAVLNASGQPAASLPLWREGKLPVGVQIFAGFGEDALLLRLAGELETSRLWREARAWPKF
ncbi:amidase [Sulfitobacter sp.]|uniref:amidase n=1 Tax=Sulfitobacter sp. TaxID=1903071 RepID=UPI00329A0C29